MSNKSLTSAKGGMYMWDTVLESLPVRVILHRDERASPLMLCLKWYLTSFHRIGESKVWRPNTEGLCLSGISEQLLHMQGSSQSGTVICFVNVCTYSRVISYSGKFSEGQIFG